MHPATLFSIMFLVAKFVICYSGKEVNLTSNCNSTEQDALLKLKASFSDPYNRLSSWNSTNIDCCRWQGVECDKVTGRVIGLDLMIQNPFYFSSPTHSLFSEMLDSSIMELKHLLFLDLSGNDFKLSSIPAFLGSMNQLRRLHLSNANFSGIIPHHLGNLSHLSVLDLSYNGINPQLIVDDIMWVSRLSSLQHLDMSFVSLDQTKDFLKVLHMLPNIVDIRLSSSGLENRNLQHDCNSISLANNIEYLDLSYNSFNGGLPCFLEYMTSLRYLDLSFNSYTSCNQLFHLVRLTNIVHLNLSANSFQCNADRIFGFLSNKHYLESLNLGFNSFHGDISKIFLRNSTICLNRNVTALNLVSNHFYGQLPVEIGGFRKLEYLNLEKNLISGPIPTSISNLSTLTHVFLDFNNFSGIVPASFVNLTSLKELGLSDNQLSGDIAIFFGHLRNLESVSIGENYFYGTISEDHFLTLSKLRYLSLGNNLIKLRVGNGLKPSFQLAYFEMKSGDMGGGPFPNWLRTQKELIALLMPNCSITGPLPNWLLYKDMVSLDLSNNHLDGSIPDSLREMSSLQFLLLSNNHIEGSLPDSLCKITSLTAVDLSKNRLSGKLPECLANLTMLYALVLSSNRLSGVIPNSIGGAYSLQWLQLSNNSIIGELPSTIKNCTELKVLDIGENLISGELPKWIGRHLLNLEVLRLKNNELYDTIPIELCQLSKLRVLDLANNKLTGKIPRCFRNFSDMVVHSPRFGFINMFGLQEVMKGLVLEYIENLIYLVNMDLSGNHLVGEIPWELTELVALIGLNLSHNHLEGMIPERIGDMSSLQSLDLSSNHLFGNIPESLSNLTFLSHLNLSYNNLTGEIPTGSQLQTLIDPSSYEGNPGLCGAPLSNKCHENKSTGAKNAVTPLTDEDKVDTIWLCGVVISGFATGLWGTIGVLVFKRGWRFVYFKFVDDIISRIFGG